LALRALLAISALTVVSTTAIAQDDFVPQRLDALEPNVSDVGPLSRSFRQLSIDLRSPSEFDRVYQVPGDEEHLMRISGGLYAVFPRSQYTPTEKKGIIAVIPNDTTFYIGSPRLGLDRSLAGVVRPNALDLAAGFDGPGASRRVLTRVVGDPTGGAIMAAPHAPAPVRVRPQPLAPLPSEELAASGPEAGGRTSEAVHGPPTIVNDPVYRAQRLRELLKRAAAG
jgi:hypothetical protein